MAEYPQRPAYWALTVIRTLQKTGAANHIGRDACWLITSVATMEDVKRYSGPVAFWNNHLMDITGLNSKQTFLKVRTTAVDAGWLHYEPGGKGTAGLYWSTIPSTAEQFLGQSVLDSPGPNMDRQVDSPGSHLDRQNICRSESGPESGPTSGPTSGPHSYLYLEPKPILSEASSDASFWFSEFWDCYGKKTGRKKADAAFRRAIKVVSKNQNLGHQEAAEHITKIATAYAAGFTDDRKFQKHPATWLNGENWNDDPSIWNPSQSHSADSSKSPSGDDWQHVQAIVRATYHPDLRNADDLRGKLTPAQFDAAKTVGLSKIASVDQWDKATPEAYRAARKAVAS